MPKNLPNVLSLFRLLLVPVFGLVYFSGWDYAHQLAVGVYALAALTDILDGYIARKYDLVSKLGRILDPMADKFMSAMVLICITVSGVIPLWAVLVILGREALMALGGALIYNKISDMPPSNIWGKMAVVLLFAVCVLLMLFDIPAPWPTVLISAVVALNVISFVIYVVTFTKAYLRQRKS